MAEDKDALITNPTVDVGTIETLVAERKLTSPYVKTMRKSVREQLETASKGLTRPDSRYGEEIRTLLQEPDAAAPEELRAHAAVLKQIEDELESA